MRDRNENRPGREEVEVRRGIDSGVFEKLPLEELLSLIDQSRDGTGAATTRPPWTVVEEYLETGAHRSWVEGYAERSEAFAAVLGAMRSEREAQKPRKQSSRGAFKVANDNGSSLPSPRKTRKRTPQRGKSSRAQSRAEIGYRERSGP